MVEKLFELSRNYLKSNNKKFKRYFLKKHSLQGRCYIIIGQRGVGKTTAMVQHMLERAGQDPLAREILYVPVDHTLVAKYTLYDIAETFYKEEGVTSIGFDEIHKYPHWARDLKSIYDVFPDLHILASGSSAMEISKSSHDLSRRSIVHQMVGMSFREFLELNLDVELERISLKELLERHEAVSHSIVKQLAEKGKRVLPLFKDYLKFGYYPYFNQHREYMDEFYLKLEQDVRKTVIYDSLNVFPNITGASVKKILKLLSLLTETVPYTPDLKDLKEKLEIGDIRTLKQYLKFLEDADVILSVSPKGRGFSQLEKPEKLYLNNTNLLYALGDNPEKGTIRETFFANTVSSVYSLCTVGKGDFLVDDKYTFEIGGKNEGFSQLKGVPNAYLVLDDQETGFKRKIPLWLFGFLY